MKVLFLTHRLPYAPNRGDRIRAYYLLREISGFASVSVFSLVHDADEAAHVGDVPFAQRVEWARAPKAWNLLRAAAFLTTSRPLTHALLDARGARARLDAIVKSDPPDVVVAYCSSMARFALQPPLHGIPFVLDMVDVDSEKWKQMAAVARGPKRWLYAREASALRTFEALATRQAAATLVVNERERAALQDIAPAAGTISVLRNGIDLEAFRPSGPPSDSPTVIFSGVMNYYPNEEGVLWFADQVWPRVLAARPDARFVIVGSDPTAAVRKLAAANASIEVTGRVPLVQTFLWRAAVAVAPLRLARGLQNKVLEALAAGLPVVVAPAVLDGLPTEALSGCRPAGNPEDFAAAVLDLLALSPEERRVKAWSGQLERLSWTKMAQPLESILGSAHRSGRASNVEPDGIGDAL